MLKNRDYRSQLKPGKLSDSSKALAVQHIPCVIFFTFDAGRFTSNFMRRFPSSSFRQRQVVDKRTIVRLSICCIGVLPEPEVPQEAQIWAYSNSNFGYNEARKALTG
jgi:hypothetical protein